MKKKANEWQRRNTHIQSFSFYNNPDLTDTNGNAKYDFYNYPEDIETIDLHFSLSKKIKFCPFCGNDLTMESDKKMGSTLKFCPYCGKSLE